MENSTQYRENSTHFDNQGSQVSKTQRSKAEPIDYFKKSILKKLNEEKG